MFPDFFLKHSSGNYTNSQRPEKGGVEMIEHISGMRLFSFVIDFRKKSYFFMS